MNKKQFTFQHICFDSMLIDVVVLRFLRFTWRTKERTKINLNQII